MALFLSRQETIDYILESERDKDQPATFKLRALTMRDIVEIEDLLGRQLGQPGYPVGSFNYRVLKKALVGWKNLFSKETSKEIVPEVDVDGYISDTSLAMLPSEVRTELANAAWEMSNLSGEDRKNLK